MKKLLETIIRRIRRVDESEEDEMDDEEIEEMDAEDLLQDILGKYLKEKGLIEPPLKVDGFFVKSIGYKDKKGREVWLYRNGRIFVDGKEVK